MEPKQPIVLPGIVQLGLPPYPAIRAVLQVRQRVAAALHRQAGGGGMSSLGTVRQGDVGTVFEVAIIDEDGAVDISNSAVRQIVFGRPVVGWFTRQAEFVTDGTDGKIRYKSQPGDFDVSGEWRLQGKVALPTFVDEFHTEMATFFVEPVIEEMNRL
jgi:hypothetical protein